jgi:hypothetical protein
MEKAVEVKKKSGDLRLSMPQTTAFIDAMRGVFGVDEVNAQIRLGMKGHRGFFYAKENGNEIGTSSK